MENNDYNKIKLLQRTKKKYILSVTVKINMLFIVLIYIMKLKRVFIYLNI